MNLKFNTSPIFGALLFAGLGLAVPAAAQVGLPPANAAPPAAAPSTAMSGYVAPTYKIGAGDVLSVNVADFPTLSTQSTVAPDGAISMPLLHQVPVTGLTVDQVTALVTKRYKTYVIDPVVTVSLIQKHPQFVVFSGEVNRPGPLDYRPGMHLVEAVAEVGGLVLNGNPATGSATSVGSGATVADPSHVSIAHEDGTKETLNLTTHPENLAGTPTDVLLTPGDVITVPQQLGKINMTGQVRQPGVIPYRENMSLFDAVSDAGGYNPDTADLPNSTLIHNGKTTLINLEPMLLHGDMTANVALSPGDQISIPEKIRTFVMGDVNRPGYYLYRPGDRVLDAISAVAGPNGQADLSKINVIHTDRVRHVSQMVRVDLNSYLLRNDPAGNPYIQPGDALYIPDKKHTISFNDVIGVFSGVGAIGYGTRVIQGKY
jgi:polysaccharide export outer membrane protein